MDRLFFGGVLMNTKTDQPEPGGNALAIFDYLSHEQASSRRTRDAVVQQFKPVQSPTAIDDALAQLERAGLIVFIERAYTLKSEGKKLAEARSKAVQTKDLDRITDQHATARPAASDSTPSTAKLQAVSQQVPVALRSGTGNLAAPAAPAAADSASRIVSQARIITNDPQMERTTREALKDLPGLDAHPLRNAQAPAKPSILTANNSAQRAKYTRYNEIHFMLGFVDRRDIPPVPILDGDTLGRDPRSHIYLRHDDAISHRQCEFQVKPDKNGGMQLWVKDLGSLNGTQIDRAPITKDKFVRLPARAHLRIGNTTLTVIQIHWEPTSLARAADVG